MKDMMRIYARMLVDTFPLREPVLREVIDFLDFPKTSRGLDAGCGIGQLTRMIAENMGPDGEVLGVDEIPGFINLACKPVASLGEKQIGGKVTFQRGDVSHLPFTNDSFDWAWSVDCIGYGSQDAMPALLELKRVVKPGGLIAILVWSSQQLLPGYPLLEAKLNATAAGIAPFKQGMKPGNHYLLLLERLKKVGLEDTMARVFAGSVAAPLNEDIRTALLALIKMRWPGADSEVSHRDWQDLLDLITPGSPAFILDHPGYYAFFNYSLFYGKVGEE